MQLEIPLIKALIFLDKLIELCQPWLDVFGDMVLKDKPFGGRLLLLFAKED